MLTRRTFLGTTVTALAAAPILAWAANPSPKKILLRSSWQDVNIGDIAHTPGMLALLEKYHPSSEITLWPGKLGDNVAAMLKTRFPKLKIASTTEEKVAARETCDFFLHGSGPSVVGLKELVTWAKTGKPYGIGGVTLTDDMIKTNRELFSKAKFFFCRDTDSLKALIAGGVTCPIMEFGPDATFLLDLKNDAAADQILASHKLEPKKFACFVPRLRWTPYWKDGRKYEAGQMEQRQAVNEEFKEVDHAKLRTAIIAWVRETKLPALLCPEMTYQVELLAPLLFDKLPDDVKPLVRIRPSYWLTDEAASVYARAAAVVSCEMHSPIIAIANGTPAIHVRQPTDTRKGQMWRDVGLGDWLFEIEAATGEQIAATLLKIAHDPVAANAQVKKAQRYVTERGERMMASIEK